MKVMRGLITLRLLGPHTQEIEEVYYADELTASAKTVLSEVPEARLGEGVWGRGWAKRD